MNLLLVGLSVHLLLILPLKAAARNENPAELAESKTVKLNPLPLDHVRLTGGPLKAAQEADAKYLLELQPDRMLAFLRQRAGLKPKAEGYGGWDGPKRNLTGHIAGHYLSAVSLMWAATGDAHFRDRANYIVDQLKEIQDAQGDGYIGALEDGQGVDGKQRFLDLSNGVIKSGGFDLNGLWSPWYVEHKLFAGLRDAYRYTNNPTALQVEIKFAAWVDKILSKLDDDQLQRMLGTEFGGMNEVLAELYADTADPRWLALADKFHQKAMIDPLSEDKDVISHAHGNTQVPKLYGALMRYVYTGNAADEEAAKFFWDRVVYHYSFATGGHGKNEYFGEPDKLNDMVDGRTAETCNVYNMLKMTRTLFSVEPDIRYADFHERALFNHILASQDPKDGTVTYMLPVGRGVQHEYQRMFEDFTCCVGTSMESHALHGSGIYYYKGSEEFWIGLYAPSIATWDSAGVEVEMSTDFPLGSSASVKIRGKTP
ncbi:MAG TPA: beta-L-arabinofuranosidase domain-containing protein, partial [Candidatus Sulfotelmatobacter sp.]|nr:beta-L-arabinofuranosidase domain-containing protein [Candidatus Sulfotelmatobacter sp.]